MRSYRKCAEIAAELRSRFLARREAGEFDLESERELAASLGAGRPTIAKALKQLAEEGLVECGTRGVRPLPFRQRFRYAYVASIHSTNGAFWFSAYQRLWLELEKQFRSIHCSIDLLTFDPDEQGNIVEEFAASLRGYDTVYLSLLGARCHFPLARCLRDLGKNVLFLNENMETEGFPLCALGNFEAGALAADTLLERGYRHTAILAPAVNAANLDFRQRINGFASVITKHGREFTLYASNLNAPLEELSLMQRCLSQLPRQDFDSAFFLDDRWISLIDPLIEKGEIPDFGILALDGHMNARTHQPPVDAISHGTIPLAEKLRDLAAEQEKNGFFPAPLFRCRITPTLYRGRTLRELA